MLTEKQYKAWLKIRANHADLSDSELMDLKGWGEIKIGQRVVSKQSFLESIELYEKNKNSQNRINDFLVELTELTKKHQIEIRDCGEFGTNLIFMDDTTKKGGYAISDDYEGYRYLNFISPTDHDWVEMQNKIARKRK